MIRTIAALLLAATAAHAGPPPADSEDAAVLGPFRAWVEGQQGPSGWCCDTSDGRMVDARIAADGHWQVHFVHPETLADAPPPGWIDVPPDAVLHTGNPTGVAVAWIYAGHIRCFAPAGGV